MTFPAPQVVWYFLFYCFFESVWLITINFGSVANWSVFFCYTCSFQADESSSSIYHSFILSSTSLLIHAPEQGHIFFPPLLYAAWLAQLGNPHSTAWNGALLHANQALLSIPQLVLIPHEKSGIKHGESRKVKYLFFWRWSRSTLAVEKWITGLPH